MADRGGLSTPHRRVANLFGPTGRDIRGEEVLDWAEARLAAEPWLREQ